MRTIANLFLMLFPAAAALAVGDEILGRFWLENPLSGLRNLCDLLSVLLAVLVYFGFAFNRHLPKLILLPLIGYLFWSLLDFWPLRELSGPDSYRLIGAGGQLLLGILILRCNRRRNQRGLLLAPSQFVGPGFSGRTFFRFCLLNILVLPMALGLLGFSAAGNLLERNTAEFVQLKPNGLYMTEKIYRRQEKTVRLVAMIHLGREDYFSDLVDSFSAGRTLILAEGVSDVAGHLKNRFSYGRLADLFGLTSQEDVHFPGRQISAEDLGKPLTGERSRADILRADIDLQEFDAKTIAVLDALGKYLLDSQSLLDGYRQFDRWAKENITPGTERVIMHDLLDRRNTRVISLLDQALASYDTIVIPWGALHMPGIEQAVIEQGFSLSASRQRKSIDFLLLPYEKLWEKHQNTR